jgi:hypothetical protein
MIQAPRSVVILVPVAPGDRGVVASGQANTTQVPVARLADTPSDPQVDREALRRSVEETLRAIRRPREELRAAGLAMLRLAA